MGKGTPVSRRARRVRNEAGPCSSLTEASTRTWVPTSEGHPYAEMPGRASGGGTHSQTENRYSHCLKTFRSPRSCGLSWTHGSLALPVCQMQLILK